MIEVVYFFYLLFHFYLKTNYFSKDHVISHFTFLSFILFTNFLYLRFPILIYTLYSYIFIIIIYRSSCWQIWFLQTIFYSLMKLYYVISIRCRIASTIAEFIWWAFGTSNFMSFLNTGYLFPARFSSNNVIFLWWLC